MQSGNECQPVEEKGVNTTREFSRQLGFPDHDGKVLPSSDKRFADGAQYRLEIPSVEGPNCLRAVIEEAGKRRLRIHRVSQGSGIMLLTDDEIREMGRMAHDQQMELSLFVGPRAPFDIWAQPLTPAGRNIGLGLRGIDQLVYALEDIRRACDLGIRGVLVANLGLLWAANEMKKTGKLPANLVIKVSVQLSASNPVMDWPSPNYERRLLSFFLEFNPGDFDPFDVFQVLYVNSNQIANLNELGDEDFNSILQFRRLQCAILLLMSRRSSFRDSKFHHFRKVDTDRLSFNKFHRQLHFGFEKADLGTN
jgi:hypothetical protein